MYNEDLQGAHNGKILCMLSSFSPNTEGVFCSDEEAVEVASRVMEHNPSMNSSSSVLPKEDSASSPTSPAAICARFVTDSSQSIPQLFDMLLPHINGNDELLKTLISARKELKTKYLTGFNLSQYMA